MRAAYQFDPTARATFGRAGFWSSALGVALFVDGLGALRNVVRNPSGTVVQVVASFLLGILFLMAGRRFAAAVNSQPEDDINASLAAVTSMGNAFRGRLVIFVVGLLLAIVVSGIASTMSE